jgi:hypothetical protein
MATAAGALNRPDAQLAPPFPAAIDEPGEIA